MDTLKRFRSLRRTKAKSEFVLTVLDLGLDFTTLYQPTTIVASVIRHGHTARSKAVLWEASLKSPKDGFCFWHPPFDTNLGISSAALLLQHQTSSSEDNKKQLHKDVYIAVENVDKRGRRKLLAKTRIDLLEYTKNCVGGGGTTTVKLKLHPETRKVSKCYANISVREARETELEGGEEEAAGGSSSSRSRDLDAVPCRVGGGQPMLLNDSQRSSIASSLSLHSSRLARSQSKDSDLQQQQTDQQAVAAAATVERRKISLTEKDDLTSSSGPSHLWSLRRRQHLLRTSILPLLFPQRSDWRSRQQSRPPPRPAGAGVGGSGHKTPLIPRAASREDDEILRWAKGVLQSYTQIKITNLSSSWRNGLGFCALLHSRFPDLIPYASLKAHNSVLNCRLALSASHLVGVDVPSLQQQGSGADLAAILNTKTVSAYLTQLRTVLEKSTELREEAVLQWQREWFQSDYLFSDKFSRESVAEFASSSFDDYSPGSIGSGVPSPSASAVPAAEVSSTSANRSRVLDLISQAHSQLNDDDDDDNKDAEDEEPANLSYITKELKLLELETDRITHEQSLLAEVIRKDESAASGLMPKYLKLVNEKNGLVKRQMQLNIQEKEEVIGARLRRIERAMQKLADVADERKTEANREMEATLLQEKMALVNEKNELVLHEDDEERGLIDDETIEARLGAVASMNNNGNSNRKGEECVLQ